MAPLKILVVAGSVALTAWCFWYESQLVPPPAPTNEAVFLAASGAEKMPPVALRPLPDVAFNAVKGGDISLAEVATASEVTLINFWATWCAPCIDELPSLLNLVADYNGRVQLITVSLDANAKVIPPFLQRVVGGMQQTHVHWVWDENKTLSENTFGVYKVPETLIVGTDLTLRDKVVGAVDWSAAAVRARVWAGVTP